MSQSDVVQIIGSSAILLLAGGLFFIARANGRHFLAYGREAMVAAACYLAVAATVRFGAVPTGAITQTQAREINGIIAIIFMLIILQDVAIIGMHIRAERKQKLID